jgi:Bacterial Ig-like domain (group 3)/IPT/TIG domain
VKRRRLLLLLGAWAAVAGVAGVAAPGALAAPTVVTFSYTGAAQTWTVPLGVWSVSFDVLGGQGADAAVGILRASGGLGGEATATVPVIPGETFQIDVGGAGESNPAPGGFNDGSGGGGSSDVRLSPFAVNDRLVVGGGGGGSGGDDAFGDAGGAGGAGGGGNGSPGSALLGIGGGAAAGGTSSAGGLGGHGAEGGQPGGGGALLSGGVGGATGSGYPGPGGFDGGADGGAGNPPGETGGGGGGGGGGLYGGGGGGSSGGRAVAAGGGGGGGGSSYGPAGTNFRSGVQAGDGVVTASYTPSTLPLTMHVAPAGGTLGGTFTATATLGPPPANGPPPTGSVTFDVYGPGDPSCAQTPVLSSTDPLDATGTSATSHAFAPTSPGTYQVTASYSGDSSYLPETSGCTDEDGALTVTKAALGLDARVAPAEATLGGTFTATATLGPPPANGPPPTGSVTFDVYGPGDPSCAQTPVFTLTNPLDAAGTSATSDAFTPPSAGTYQVTASYAGDSDYLPAGSGCADPDGTLTVAAPPPTVTGLDPASGPAAGGNEVTITGTAFTGATAVEFGSAQASGITVVGPDQLTASVPPGSGTVDVQVTTPAGVSSTGSADRYTYTAAPLNTAPGPTPTPAPTPAASPSPVSVVAASLAATPAQPVSQTGTPKVLGSSGAQFTATIDPEGLPTTMHFEYAVEPAGASAAAIAYTARTPEQTVGSDFSDHTVTATVAGLVPGSVYHVRAVATNPSGTTAGADATFTTAKAVPPPPPVLGKSFNAQPVSGRVYFFLPAHTRLSEPLAHALSLPVGTIVDATHGTLRLTSATTTKGKVQSGEFGGGRFEFLQDRRERGLTELSLVDPTGTNKACEAPPGHAAAAAKRLLPKADLVLLKATAKGRFEVHGHYSSATVRGTSWTTSNRCDGTFTSVKLGVVVVDDFRRHRLILLRGGHSYLAKA